MTAYREGVKAQPLTKPGQIIGDYRLIQRTVHTVGYGLLVLTFALKSKEGLILYATPCVTREDALKVYEAAQHNSILVGCYSVKTDESVAYMRNAVGRVLRWHTMARPSRNLTIPDEQYEILATSRSQAIEILRSYYPNGD